MVEDRIIVNDDDRHALMKQYVAARLSISRNGDRMRPSSRSSPRRQSSLESWDDGYWLYANWFSLVPVRCIYFHLRLIKKDARRAGSKGWDTVSGIMCVYAPPEPSVEERIRKKNI
jgi:hypothetical protein